MKFKFFFLLQTYGLVKHEKRKCSMKFSVPEIKILILLSYFYLLGTFFVIYYSIVFREDHVFFSFFLEYITCQLLGENPECEGLRKEFEMHFHPEPGVVLIFLLAILPWFYSMLFIEINDFRNIIQRISSCYHAKFSSKNSPF